VKTVTAKDLRFKTSQILNDVKMGNELLVTLHGKPAARLVPLSKDNASFRPIGFGLWADREDMEDVDAWIDGHRRERKEREDDR
jgi:prevent-host-death family protein